MAAGRSSAHVALASTPDVAGFQSDVGPGHARHMCKIDSIWIVDDALCIVISSSKSVLPSLHRARKNTTACVCCVTFGGLERPCVDVAIPRVPAHHSQQLPYMWLLLLDSIQVTIPQRPRKDSHSTA